jgi:biotin-(acetyl-CoA carboxylase) ligase
MARGLNKDGALLLETQDGQQHLLQEGDLILSPCPCLRV